MGLRFSQGDIVECGCIATVSSASTTLSGDSGVEGAIFEAAGPQLREYCKELNGCEPGQAHISMGYDLGSFYIVHTAGPEWQGGSAGERDTLERCYRQSIDLARSHGTRTMAFPVIATGACGYPMDEAVEVATQSIVDELAKDRDMDVQLMFHHKEDYDRYCEKYPQFVDED